MSDFDVRSGETSLQDFVDDQTTAQAATEIAAAVADHTFVVGRLYVSSSAAITFELLDGTTKNGVRWSIPANGSIAINDLDLRGFTVNTALAYTTVGVANISLRVRYYTTKTRSFKQATHNG